MQQCPCTETPQEEGARLYSEGLGLSDLWGDCSAKNFPEFGKVVEAFDSARANPALREARSVAIRNRYIEIPHIR